MPAPKQPVAASSRLIAGAMSGTSADGVDVALVQINGQGIGMNVKLLRHHHAAYDPVVRDSIFEMRASQAGSLAQLAQIGCNVSLTYARAVNEALHAEKLSAKDVACIAAHGQTLFHKPPNTIQWLDPALLAAEVGCAVVSDFRRADCAAGGQGAPLVPFADYILFRHPTHNRLLINVGGIANVTYIPADSAISKIVAFDTGPGNCICDELCRILHPEGPGVDMDGVLAAHGKPDETIALKILGHEYFCKPPPKSTDGPAMIALMHSVVGDLGGRARLPDLLATACLVTAAAIGRAGRMFVPQFPDEIILSGGGTQNRTMMAYLKTQLGGGRLRVTDELGFPYQAKEAIAFAMLAAATLDGQPSNVPSATGARRAVVLGSITPAPHA
ncbi:MAG: anhydro-N-acetylmuramic acid kinase [Anaerolineae bacterium]|nr:anhydro-N-acetylmuramic acid kinase [Phycisphaerae bacterium]